MRSSARLSSSSPSKSHSRITLASSSRPPKRTYSRKVALHAEKRRAEAEAGAGGDDGLESTDDEEVGDVIVVEEVGRDHSKRAAGSASSERSGGSRLIGGKPKQIFGAAARTNGKAARGDETKQTISPSSSSSSPSKSAIPLATPQMEARTSLGRRTRSTTSIPSEPDSPTPSTSKRPRINVIPASSLISIPAPTSPHKSPTLPSARNLVPTVLPQPKSKTAIISPGKSDNSIHSQDSVTSTGSGSASGSGSRLRSPRKMLTKSQSLGHTSLPGTPSRLREVKTPEPSPGRTFGSAMTPPQGFGTPSRGLTKSSSMPDTPSRRALYNSYSVNQSPGKGSPGGSNASNNGIGSGNGTGSGMGGLSLPEIRSGGSSGGKTQRTYGRARSFLADGTARGAGVSTTSLVRENLESIDHELEGEKESYAELRKRYEVDNGVSSSGGQGNLMAELISARAPQPVSDMRSKGENRRFMDEIGFLVDGIKDPSANMAYKRSSSADILVNMLDEIWLSKMKLCGQTERIWEALSSGSEDEEIMDVICLMFLTMLIPSGGFSPMVQSHGDGILDITLRTLKRGKGVFEHVNNRPTPTITKVRTLLQELDVGWSSSVSCARRLASFMILTLQSDQASPAIQQSSEVDTIEVLLSTFAMEVRRTCDRFDLYELGHTMSSPEDPSDPDHILQCLRLLSITISKPSEARDAVAEHWEQLPMDVMNTLVAMTALALAEDSQIKYIAANCAMEALEILTNMANITSTWTEQLPTLKGVTTSVSRILLHREQLSDLLRRSPPKPLTRDRTAGRESSAGKSDGVSEGRGGMEPDDILCISLALLTTTISSRGEAAEPIALLRVASYCKDSRQCLRVCQCKDSVTLGDHLAQLYRTRVDMSDESTSGIITGYLALLITKLITLSPAARDLILLKLPGENTPRKVEGLTNSLQELTELQMVVHRKLKDIADKRGGADEEDGIENSGGAVDEEEYKIEVALGGREVLEKDSGVLEGAIRDLEELLK